MGAVSEGILLGASSSLQGFTHPAGLTREHLALHFRSAPTSLQEQFPPHHKASKAECLPLKSSPQGKIYPACKQLANTSISSSKRSQSIPSLCLSSSGAGRKIYTSNQSSGADEHDSSWQMPQGFNCFTMSKQCTQY